MWIEETPNGKFKFCERYRDPYTGKQKKVSVTMDKQTAKARKQAFEILQGKIDRNLSATNQADLTLNELKKEASGMIVGRCPA